MYLSGNSKKSSENAVNHRAGTFKVTWKKNVQNGIPFCFNYNWIWLIESHARARIRKYSSTVDSSWCVNSFNWCRQVRKEMNKLWNYDECSNTSAIVLNDVNWNNNNRQACSRRRRRHRHRLHNVLTDAIGNRVVWPMTNRVHVRLLIIFFRFEIVFPFSIVYSLSFRFRRHMCRPT